MRIPWIVIVLAFTCSFGAGIESAEPAALIKTNGSTRSTSSFESASAIRTSFVRPLEPLESIAPSLGLPPDFKKQSIPKNLPKLDRETPTSPPNLDSLIDQLIRHSELEFSARKILPWVYGTSTEIVVADFELALNRIDLAGHELELAMYRAFFEVGSTETDPNLTLAKSHLDNAEFTILMLVEMAKLEL